MFTIDYFTHVDATPIESRTVDGELVDDAIGQAEAMLASQAAAPGHAHRSVGYGITAGLNPIVYNPTKRPGAPGEGPPDR